MSKWIVTLEIAVDATDRRDALNVADNALGISGFEFMLYDAQAEDQSGAGDAGDDVDYLKGNVRL